MILKRICPICDCNDGKKLYELRLAKDPKEKVIKKSTIVYCNNCGFIFDNNDYTQKDYDEYYKSTTLYSSNINSVSGSGGDNREDLEHYDFQIDKVKKFINDKDVDILDIGCAKGGLLRRFKYYGYNNLYGIEFEKSCINILKENNINAEIGGIFDIYKFNKKFDVIIISHVLEHIWDLKTAIKLLKTYLKKDGVLYIEVPDMCNYSNYFYKPFYYFNFDHCNHFTINTLTKLFSDFECLEKMNSYIYVANNKKYPIIYIVLKNSEETKDIFGINKIKEYINKSYEIENKFCSELKFDSFPTFLYGFGFYSRRLLMQENIFKNINLVGIIDRNPAFKDFTVEIYNGNKIPVYIIEDDNLFFLRKYKYVNVLIASPTWEIEIRDYLLNNKNFVGKIILVESDQIRSDQIRSDQIRSDQIRYLNMLIKKLHKIYIYYRINYRIN